MLLSSPNWDFLLLVVNGDVGRIEVVEGDLGVVKKSRRFCGR